jgi:hypothetical protein
MEITAQSSLSLSGCWPAFEGKTTLLNSFESNPSNFSLLKDWGLVLSYGGEFSNEINSNIYLISLSKRIREHNLSIRYTPGYQKEFFFQPIESYRGVDSLLQSLSSRFSYKEIFGFGYSYKFSNVFSSGFNFRYFTEDFNSEVLDINIISDSIYFFKNNQSEKNNFWKGDLGAAFSPFDNLFLTVNSVNLLILAEDKISGQNEVYKLKREKGALIGLTYSPFNEYYLNLLYETNNSFQAGATGSYKIVSNGELTFGAALFHDELQSPFFAGIVPAVSFSTELFNITVSGVKYFSDRKAVHSYAEFSTSGLNNIINNKYSFDKLILTLGFTLNTLPERLVKFGSVEVLKDIYPTFTDDYLNTPFAVGYVINLTDNPVNVKPSSHIEGINNENIHSPIAVIPPKDTVKVFFYTIIPDTLRREKTGISYADFYLTTVNETPDDKFQKPVLVNNKNSWDGKVINLRYFIKNDFDFSMGYTKNILSRYKNILDTLNEEAAPFSKAKLIFDELVKEIVYTSDPRASFEYVQFPHETIKLKGGDCDDLAVCYSSLLESVGIQTAVVDYRKENEINHVNVLLNTGLSPGEAKLITGNDQKYLLRKSSTGIDEVWIPIETTSLTNFESAWDTGSEKFYKDAIQNFGISKGNVEIIDIY